MGAKVMVQCKGSGQTPLRTQGPKRGVCPSCGRQRDLTGAGKIRRHDRITTKRRLKRL